MKSFDEFFSEYFDDGFDLFPRISVRFKEQFLALKDGGSINYEDIVKFVIDKDYNIEPYFCKQDIDDSYKVVDYAPLISLAISELVLIADSFIEGSSIITDFSKYLNQALFTLDTSSTKIESILSELHKYKFASGTPYDLLLSLRNCRSYVNDWRKSDFTKKLYIIYLLDKKCYSNILVGIMNMVTRFIIVYFNDINNIISVKGSDIKKDNFDFERAIKFKKIGYTAPKSDKKFYISDCDGLAVMSFCLLMFSLFDKYAEYTYNDERQVTVFREEDNLLKFQKMFKDCVGNDATSRFLRGRGYKMDSERDMAHSALSSVLDKLGLADTIKHSDFDDFLDKNLVENKYKPIISPEGYPMFIKKFFYLDDTDCVFREEYERRLLFTRAHKVSFNKGLLNRNTDSSNDIYIIHRFSFLECLTQLCYFAGYKAIGDLEETTEKYESQISSLNEKIKNYKSELEQREQSVRIELEEKYQSIIQDYDKKIEDLNSLLISKSNIIADLHDELSSVHQQFQSCLPVTEEITVTEDDISIEEMLEFLNDFVVCIISCKNNFVEQLHDLGWQNVFQVDNQNFTRSNCDFIVIHATDVAHKIIFRVSSVYNDKSDCIMYFNGANKESLIRECYTFINNWING